jgi:hypothetical protein
LPVLRTCPSLTLVNSQLSIDSQVPNLPAHTTSRTSALRPGQPILRWSVPTFTSWTRVIFQVLSPHHPLGVNADGFGAARWRD